MIGKGNSRMKKKFLILGGDLRQIACARCLQKKGYDVVLYGFYDLYLGGLFAGQNLNEDLMRADYVLLPLPVTQDGEFLHTPLWDKKISLQQITNTLREETVVFGGMIRDGELLQRKMVFDYAKNEEFLIKNAQITVEGAFHIAFSETPFSVFGSKILITGYGRIGKILAKIAQSLGAETYVAARKTGDLSWIELSGAHPVRYDKLGDLLPHMQIIFNTVPSPIFQKSRIEKIHPDCLFIDLASVPGGIDWAVAKELGVKTIWALSLPGKIAPYSSGKIIADTVINLINKE